VRRVKEWVTEESLVGKLCLQLLKCIFAQMLFLISQASKKIRRGNLVVSSVVNHFSRLEPRIVPARLSRWT
jgi:hypothetical protein